MLLTECSKGVIIKTRKQRVFELLKGDGRRGWASVSKLVGTYILVDNPVNKSYPQAVDNILVLFSHNSK